MALENYPFYEELNEEVQNFLKMRLQPVEVPKDTILFFEGDVCDSVIFLESGTIRLYMQEEKGEEITLYELQAGEQCIVNTASTLSQTEAIATAVTTSDIKGYIMDMYSIQDFARMSEAYQKYIFSLYSLQMKGVIQKVHHTQNIDEALWNHLNEQGSKRVHVDISDLAQKLSSDEATIQRVLKSLENDKALKIDGEFVELA